MGRSVPIGKSARERYQKKKASAVYIFQIILNDYILEQNIFIDYILELSKANNTYE